MSDDFAELRLITNTEPEGERANITRQGFLLLRSDLRNLFAEYDRLRAQLAAAEQRAKEAFDLMAQERDNFVKAGQQMRADTIEECALWCEEVGRAGKHDKRDSWAGNCASAIRQLAKSERTDQ